MPPRRESYVPVGLGAEVACHCLRGHAIASGGMPLPQLSRLARFDLPPGGAEGPGPPEAIEGELGGGASIPAEPLAKRASAVAPVFTDPPSLPRAQPVADQPSEAETADQMPCAS